MGDWRGDRSTITAGRRLARRGAAALLTGGAAWFVIAVSGAESSLIEAVRRSDVAAVRTLIERGADVNAPEADGTTALHWAARADDRAVAELLLGAGAKVAVANRYGMTPVQLAAGSRGAEVLGLLLDAGGHPDTALPEGETALMTASRTGNVDAIRLLGAHGAEVDARESWHDQTAIMWAAAENHPEAIDALVELGADVHARSEAGFTAILFAAREGRIEAADALLRHGANVDDVLSTKAGVDQRAARAAAAASGAGVGNARPYGTPEGTSALVLAIGNANYEFVRFLLEKGATPNAAEQGWTALHQLQYTRRHVRTRGLPPPEVTGTLDSLGVARVLVAYGADPNARQTMELTGDGQRNILNRIGATPLLLAAKHADAPMVRALVALGADPLLTTAEDANALQVAAGVGIFAPGESVGSNDEAFEVVKLAYDLGIRDVNHVDLHGWTALHGAAVRGSNEIVEFLVARGADLQATTRQDPSSLSGPVPQVWTPLQIADGVVYANTFKRAEHTADLLRQMLRERGLPVPDVPQYDNDSDVANGSASRP
ncbi:MAG: hypothetical protein FJW23_08405 [Acidimicrobiia bacterium]|nr:hypothetical protein [Acidimicrobiia bacterium]